MTLVARRAPFLLAAVGVLALVALPRLTADRRILTWALLILLNAALAQSWNLLSGFGGQVNLGHAAFFGLGAVVTRALWLTGTSLAIAPPAAAGAGAAA